MSDQRSVRWWPLWAILVFDLGLVTYLQLFQESLLGFLMMASQILTFLLAFLWLMFLSRLPGKTRLGWLGGILGFIALFFTLFRVKDIDGDLVPTFTWRWSKTEYSSKITRGNTELEQGKIEDYPQYLGRGRDAIVKKIQLERDWKQHPPKLLWERSVGLGWSAFAVKDKLAVTQEQHDDKEMVICYELDTGKIKWAHEDLVRHSSPQGGVGPRSTPTIDGQFVYALGATGILNCLQLDNGSKIWSVDIVKGNNAKIPQWGKSCSPLVIGNNVIVSAGGKENRSLVAYNKETGKFVWGGGTDESSYSSPAIATIHGVQQILMFNRYTVAAHNPDNGSILWEHEWSKRGSANIAQPIVVGSQVLFGASYGIGSKLFDISVADGKFSAKIAWKSKRMKPKFTNMVYRDGYVYGLDSAVLGCIDFKTGKRMWRDGRYGHGQLILVGDLLLIHSESGYLALVEANSKEFKEISQFSTLGEKTWNPPALAGNYLLLRNHRKAVCYELAVKQSR
ncbi:PQQ-binding-like beta-propeller repeat protein [Candidatus Uabimicrobium amorphum]|uniref:Alcohol dehydrogenase n=1 Tax=Uabimicrobium amorphum TaxID=2596890 RepID=A0A5S9IPL9_UABAM|nr:PQQ-binding-like beta-propeller repeat protein [Candidatus Uabimicrobium amorphum]BBM85132.1 alcohol dehydrogenase [Candidatus Uabimicrobium amorphum]